MDTFKRGWAKFTEIAHQKGLTKKVVGAYSYTNTRQTRFISVCRMGRDGRMVVWEGKQGERGTRYEVEF